MWKKCKRALTLEFKTNSLTSFKQNKAKRTKQTMVSTTTTTTIQQPTFTKCLKKSSLPNVCHSSCSTGCLLLLLLPLLGIPSLRDCSSPPWRFPLNLDFVKFLLLSITYRKRIWRTQTARVNTTIKIHVSMMDCILLQKAGVLHWELVNLQLVAGLVCSSYQPKPGSIFNSLVG